METLNASTIEFEIEIKTLREKLEAANSEISMLKQNFQHANLSAEGLIVKYENIIRQKDEFIKQLEEQRNNSKQYKLAKELEAKLEAAENYINKMALETLNSRGDFRIKSRARLSVLSTDLYVTSPKIQVNKNKIDPNLLKNFEKLDELIKSKAFEYDENMVLDIETKERRKSSVDYPQLIDNLQEIVKEEERIRVEREEELEELKKDNMKLRNVTNALTKKLEESDENQLELMVEIDSLKNNLRNIINEADRYKIEIERLSSKLNKINQSSENSNIEVTELRIRMEELEDELSNLKLE